MMPLASWLDCSWRHCVSSPGYSAVLAAAKRLDEAVWAQHQFKLLFVSDPSRFRDLSEREVERMSRGVTPECEPEYPQLGTHADATCRHLTSDNFFSLIGTRTDRPLPLYTTNTAALYEARMDGDCIRNLFVSRRLWSDFPDRDCAELQAEMWGICLPPILSPLPAVFLGTAWVRQDRRRQGIMGEVSRLHRMVAWLRYGPIPQFATIAPDRNHDKLFDGTDIGCVIETRPTHTTTSRVLYYSPEAILAAAERVLSSDNVNRTHE